MCDLSVIVPVYNTKIELLERCFNSILELRDICFELIIVDDGSEGQIGLFCREYSEKKKCCRYIRKQNGGVSSARNEGIRSARGKFLMFVDSDDILEPAGLKFNAQMDYDIVIYDSMMQKGTRKFLRKNIVGIVYEGELELTAVLKEMLVNNALTTVWGILYKADFVASHSLHFDENYFLGEDTLFNLNALNKSAKIYYIPEILYLYCYRARTSLARWKYNPDVMLLNEEKNFLRRYKLVVDSGWPDTKELLQKLNTERIKAVFDMGVNLCNTGNLSGERKKYLFKLMSASQEADQKNIMLRRICILHNKWCVLRLFADMRALYFRLFKIL